MILLFQLILPRHTYLYIFALSILKIMCKFAKLTKNHQKVNPTLIPLSCSNQLQKKQPKLILNYTSTVLKRPTEIYFLILNKVSDHKQALIEQPGHNILLLKFVKAVVVKVYIYATIYTCSLKKIILKLHWRIPLLHSIF